MNDETMNEEPATPQETEDNDLLPEYDFDYSKARPNPFIERIPGSKVMVIEPDVASVFTTQEQVNSVLRAIINAMPETALKTSA